MLHVRSARRGPQRGEAVDRQKIRFGAEAADDALGDRRDRRMVAKFLARENVREMHFDDRRVDRADRIVERDRGMRVGAGVQNHAGRIGRLVQPVDQVALVVRLAEHDLKVRAVFARSRAFASMSASVSVP